MLKPTTIPRKLPADSPLNYEFLRAEGIRNIQKLAGDVWTDHNAHDPGITILEQLCYTITDLAYRIDTDIPHLLGRKGTASLKDLYSPAEIMTVNPVTLFDLRKAVIDVPGVKNGWIEKLSASGQDSQEPNAGLRGLYRVVFEKEESVGANSGIIASVRAKLRACRNICEDFEEIRQLSPQQIQLHGSIEVGQVEDIHEFISEVLLKAANHISPGIRFYSLQEMLAKGRRMEDVFDGPALEHGFIEDEELRKTGRKSELQTSDILREIMDVQGVLAVSELGVSSGSSARKNWVFPLDMAKAPKLDARATLNKLEFVRNGLPTNFDAERAFQLFLKKRDAQQKEKLPLAARDLQFAETEELNLESYYSIQNQFPANFGIGEVGLPETAAPQRKAAAKQLKAYLALFEQTLASFYSQTAHFKDLLSFGGEDKRTYFRQSLLNVIPGFEENLQSVQSYQDFLKEMEEDSAVSLDRKNRFLNHLLARFSEAFTDYGLLFQDTENEQEHYAACKLIEAKAQFLQSYPALSGGRGRAADYSGEFWDTAEVSGLEQRIAGKLGIPNQVRGNLGAGDKEGFHLVEHLMLRPNPGISRATQSTPNPLTAFEQGKQAGFTTCRATGHGLEVGDRVEIRGAGIYDGIHLVPDADADSFEIEVEFDPNSNPGASPEFQNNHVDISELVFSNPIKGVSAGSRAEHSFCESPDHGLVEGQSIEITGSWHYNGTYKVTATSADGFEIDASFVENESGARWKNPNSSHDPYSLQLSLVFPNWADRYARDNFRAFVSNTVREETPAHLTVYLQWLDKSEMNRFDHSFRKHLAALNTLN